MAKIGFVAAVKQFFGVRPGQPLMSLAAEIKALSHQEKMDIAKMLREQAGIDCEDPTEKSAA